jgi:hypothetical protein
MSGASMAATVSDSALWVVQFRCHSTLTTYTECLGQDWA